MELGLKWVHMARYELILRQDEAIWLRIIFETLLTPQRVMKDLKNQTESKMAPRRRAIHAPDQMRHGHMLILCWFRPLNVSSSLVQHFRVSSSLWLFVWSCFPIFVQTATALPLALLCLWLPFLKGEGNLMGLGKLTDNKSNFPWAEAEVFRANVWKYFPVRMSEHQEWPGEKIQPPWNPSRFVDYSDLGFCRIFFLCFLFWGSIGTLNHVTHNWLKQCSNSC